MISDTIAFILGLVEGLTEFLPISSTAHLILVSEAVGLMQTEIVKTFEVVIQGGAILAVLVLYWRRFLDLEIMKRVVVAFVPTALLGLALYTLIKRYLIGNVGVVLAAMAIGGVLLMAFEYRIKHKGKDRSEPYRVSTGDELRELGYGRAILIGLAQAVAVIPGVSRSAASVIGGLWLGMSRVAIVEFSFLLAVPTILAAAGYDFLRNFDALASGNLSALWVGFVAAFVTALIAIKFLISYVGKHSFVAFGVYRIVIAAAFLALLYTKGLIFM